MSDNASFDSDSTVYEIRQTDRFYEDKYLRNHKAQINPNSKSWWVYEALLKIIGLTYSQVRGHL